MAKKTRTAPSATPPAVATPAVNVTPPTATKIKKETTATAPAPSDPFSDRILAFAEATGKGEGVIHDAIVSLTGEGADAASILADPTAVTDDDLKAVLVSPPPSIPLGVFRKHLSKLRGAPAVVESSNVDKSVISYEILPSVPEEASFLEMLKIGGVLKPQTTEVIAAIKAALANRAGVYELPKIIASKMEQFAEAQEETVSMSEYFELRKLILSRGNYGEILSVLNVDAAYVSETRRQEFLAKLDTYVWDEVQGFYQLLKNWNETWASGFANPAMQMNIMTGIMMGKAGSSVMPAGMMQPPDTATLRDGAEEVINKINKAFAPFGVPVARVLAADAIRIRNVLEKPNLPLLVGATNRDQMLKMLGITVGADYVRLERNITRFTLAIMELPKVTSGDEELRYLTAMIMLGAMIPWDKLPRGSAAPKSGLGAHKRNGTNGNDDEDSESASDRMHNEFLRTTSGARR